MTSYVKRFTLAADVTAAAGITTNAWTGLGGQPPIIQRQDIHVTGTFGGGTAQLVYSIDGGANWINVPADKDANIVSLTAAGLMTIKARFPLLGISLTGSTTPAIVVLVV